MSWKPITYEALKDKFDVYTWNVKIGDYGGFSYKKDNHITDKPIDVANIGEIKRCSDNKNYSLKNDVVGLSKTNVELPMVPRNSDFGWDHECNCWTYFTDNTSGKPTYYSEYII